ncbi:WD40-repeat-containing domain protein [Chytriomyces sp. MP71]|nr:WD40-repeat-containing domain protein [Chytriomyces sp. MP71]
MTISSIVWVPKGAAKEAPTRFNMSETEYESIQTKIAKHISDIKDEAPAQAVAAENEATKAKAEQKAEKGADAQLVAEFDLDNYDDDGDNVDFLGNGGDDEEESDDENGNLSDDEDADATEKDESAMFSSVKGLTYHDADTQDPYVTLDDAVNEAEELEEMMVAKTDNLILAAKTEDDISHVEVYLYEGEEDNLFVHHDIMLPSFPLCLEWLNYDIEGKGQGKGSFVAVGTFDPEIEIWDLDIIDPAYPSLILGGTSNPTEALGTGKKKRRSKKPSNDYHVDAIMCLAWNKLHPSLLASGSADTTIKLWDLSSSTPEVAIRSFSNHKAKVQGLAWNPSQGQVLLSGGYDKQSHIFDTRTPTSVLSFKLSADVECLKWDPIHPERFLVSTEDGIVKCFDGRSPKAPVFTIHAHDGAVSALDISSRVDGLVVTGSTDKATKVWNTRDSTAIKCLASRDLQVGKVYSASFSPDDDMVVGVAGGAGKLMVWNLEGNASVRRVVRGADAGEVKRKEITGVEEDDEDEDEDADDMDED